MSLFVYSGVPGSGKTYHAVMDMCHNSAPIITNVICDIDNAAVLHINEITPRLLMAFSSWYFEVHEFKENELLLVIDEAQLLFNARNWNDTNRFSWLEFLSQHRKYGYKIIFIAQSIDMIDKQFRCLCEFDVRHTAASSVSFFLRGLAKLGIKATCANYYFFDSDLKISREIFYLQKTYYSKYDTSQDITLPSFSDVDISPILDQLAPCCVSDGVPPDTHRRELPRKRTLNAARAPD